MWEVLLELLGLQVGGHLGSAWYERRRQRRMAEYI